MKYRRTLAATIAVLVAAVAAVAAPPSAADAATYQFHGVVLDANGGAPLAGIVITATEPAVTGIAWTTTTAADGTWSIDVGAEEYQLRFDSASDHQSGYQMCSGFVSPNEGDPGVCTSGSSEPIETRLFATFASGRILDGDSFTPVAGALVTATREDGVTVLATGVTAADGTYRVDGLVGDEIGLQVDGSSVGYSSGWFACADGVVVPTFGEACTHAPGVDGDRYLDADFEEPRFRLRSRARTAIKLIVRDPGTDRDVIGYELSCRSRRTGETTTVTYETDHETASGFARGINRCRLQVLTEAGPGPESRTRTVRVR